MENKKLLEKLIELKTNKGVLNKNPTSDEYSEWSANILFYVGKVDYSMALELKKNLHYASIGLSSYSRDPLIHSIHSTLNEAILKTQEKVELLNPIKGEYSSGEQFELYCDLKKLIKNAKKEIFYIDPYLESDMLELCFDKVENINLRILTNKPTKEVTNSIKMLKNKKNLNLESKETNKLHDRYLFIDDKLWAVGQSLKDAASRKPTYIVELHPSVLKKEHEEIWLSSSNF